MKKVLRIFLKGEPRSWLEFEIPEGATFYSMLGQAKFEGWVIAADRMVAFDSIAAAFEVHTTTAPTMHFGPTVGNA
jgi:hypothetical protein